MFNVLSSRAMTGGGGGGGGTTGGGGGASTCRSSLYWNSTPKRIELMLHVRSFTMFVNPMLYWTSGATTSCRDVYNS